MDLSRKTITELARELRSNPTLSEKQWWEVLRKRRLNGFKFVRQKPIVHEQINRQRYFYIADFYCAELKLIIELDGKIHELQKREDYQRDFVLNNLNYKVLRIKNEELVNMNLVKEKILNYA